MDIKAARAKYHDQKKRARKNGVGWELTFQQWLEWWGADLDRRGRGHDQLQMQRFADSGPYALWNIRKGHPRDNAKTASLMRATRQCREAAANKFAAEMAAPAVPYEPEDAALALVVRPASNWRF